MPNERRKLIAVQNPPAGVAPMSRAPGLAGPLVKSGGNIDLVCSACDRVVGEATNPDQFRNLALQCECGKFCLTSGPAVH